MEHDRKRVRQLQEELEPRKGQEQDRGLPREDFPLELPVEEQGEEPLALADKPVEGKPVRQKDLQTEVEQFMEVYPDVKGEDIPQEVWKEVEQGAELLTAYVLYENRLLRAKLEAREHTDRNRSRSLGSLADGMAPRGKKTLEQYWDEAW